MTNSCLWAVFARQGWKAVCGVNSSSSCWGPWISNSLNLEVKSCIGTGELSCTSPSLLCLSPHSWAEARHLMCHFQGFVVSKCPISFLSKQPVVNFPDKFGLSYLDPKLILSICSGRCLAEPRAWFRGMWGLEC